MQRCIFSILTIFLFLSFPLPGFTETTNTAFNESRLNFDLPGQHLTDALLEFGAQSHISLVVDAKLLKDHRSSPVVGTFTPQQALKLLLSRAPFKFIYDADLSSIIINAKEPDAPIEEQAALVETEVDFDEIEELFVTGIRGSLMKAMDIKFAASGIVDAITEEDIGKFPDTNLAESLQRISGVTISYSNNEGNKINVRGFDADFNLVLLNGRHMPTADINGDNNAGTRAFNFADLASENIAAVEVYKNSSADRPTGGIGSVINIKTSRPFDLKANTASLGVKMVADTSNVEGDDITPEISGLFSTKSEDQRFGFLISGSYQARDSRAEIAEVNWSKTQGLAFPDGTTLVSVSNTERIWYPIDITYTVTDYQRKRTNAQAVIQFSPSPTFTATADYTYSELDQAKTGFDIYSQFLGRMANSNVTVEDNGTVSQGTELGGRHHFSRFKSETKNTNQSIGINLDYQPSDNWAFQLDLHSSESKLLPYGAGNSARITLNTTNIYTQSFNTNFDIPVVDLQFVDQYDDSGNPLTFRDEVALSDIYNQASGKTQWSTMKSQIEQIQLDGKWENPDYEGFLQHVKFGLGRKVLDNRSTNESYRLHDPFASLGDEYADLFDLNLFTQEDTGQFFNQFSGGLDAIPYIYNFDIDDLAQSVTDRLISQGHNNYEYGDRYRSRRWAPLGNLNGDPLSDNSIKETTDSAFIQLKLATNTQYLPTEILAGLRHEKTQLETSSHFAPIDNIRWFAPGSIAAHFSDTKVTLKAESESNVTLPSISLRTSLTDSLILRMAYSKTLTRPPMEFIRTEEIPTLPLPGRSARYSRQGSPDLKPYSAKNYDLSIDWYYGESNYIALSFYRKQVDGYPARKTEEKPLFNITDVYTGPRAEAVREELIASGIEPNDTNVYNRLIELYPPEDGESGISGNADDPLLIYTVYSAINAEQVNINGWEFALQQLFWQSGFGVVFNYTHVESDVEFGINSSDFETSLPSSSDFANFIGFYDKHGLQVRLAYHWNGEYPTLISPSGPTGGVYSHYTESYGQWDALISYTWFEKLTVSLEGINITDESQRTYNGEENRLVRAEQFGPRYQVGMRYSF